MKSTTQWLDQAKAKHGLSDYALARLVGLNAANAPGRCVHLVRWH